MAELSFSEQEADRNVGKRAPGFLEEYERHLRNLWPDVIATPGWKSRGNGLPWAVERPVGMINHHLVVPLAPSYEQSSLNMVINGHSKLSGPLANIMTAADGTIYLVAGKPANHAGRGSSVVLARTRAELAPRGNAADVGLVDDIIGNNWYWGNECQHPGDSSIWPNIQIRAVYAANAAFCRATGCKSACCINHREWSRRKIDMSWRGELRAGTQLVLDGDIAPLPPVPEDEVEMYIGFGPGGATLYAPGYVKNLNGEEFSMIQKTGVKVISLDQRESDVHRAMMLQGDTADFLPKRVWEYPTPSFVTNDRQLAENMLGWTNKAAEQAVTNTNPPN